MKLLSIGNSFSVDAQRWLHDIAVAHGVDLYNVNLYIGGCSLMRHWNNVVENKADYDLYIYGISVERKISIAEALEMDAWDVITVQQASPVSGKPNSYEPYLSNLANLIRETNPNAKLYFHQTWAYELDAPTQNFLNYDRDQRKMYECIVRTTEDAAKSIDADLIPSGRVIQYLREHVPEFDYANGGLSLNRDGHHLSMDYGRYAAGATWFASLFGKKLLVKDLIDFDPLLIGKINATVNEICFSTNQA